MFKTSEFRGNARSPIRFHNMRGEELFNLIKSDLPYALKEQGVPANIREDVVKSGGMFGSKSPMLIISYPNPPTSFFHIGILVNDNVVSFPLLGESEQNTKLNKKKYYQSEGSFIRAAMIHPDEFILQQEEAWQLAVIDAFDSMTE